MRPEDTLTRLSVPAQTSGLALLLLICALAILSACAAFPSGTPPMRFAKKQCLDCHTEFAGKYLGMKDVHAPVQEKNCEACH